MTTEDFIPVIGLEVHVQLKTRTKMFCSCPTGFGDPPNTNVCPVCLGMPGSLPVLNRAAIEKTILAGLMLGCETPPVTKWDRKNYFYPDMPKDYQISQFDLPLCDHGAVPLYPFSYPKDAQKTIENPDKSVRLTRIHLEEDVAKSTHYPKTSGIDFNRAGTPLMEIVSEPDIASPEEAFAYLNSLRQILVYGDLSDADMEKGQMRCDVNVSVRPRDQEELGVKIELKNMNSASAVRRALHYEIGEQIEILLDGGTLGQCTKRWNDERGYTEVMRRKEDAHDYRYFPDPDLLPVETAEMLEAVRSRMPEMPHEKVARFVSGYSVSEYDATVLASDRALADYFEAAAAGADHPKGVANWIINDLLSAMNSTGFSISDCPVSPEHLRSLSNLIHGGKISNNIAKEQVFPDMLESGADPALIVKEKDLVVESDTGTLEPIIDQVFAENPKVVADIQGGNAKSANFLTGQVMKLTKGKANPKIVGEMIRGKLADL